MTNIRQGLALFLLLVALGAVVVLVSTVIRVVAVFEDDRQRAVITEENRETIIVALNRYYADHSEYSASLNDLVPAYLPEIPDQLPTLNTGWQYKSTPAGFVFGCLEWPDKLALSSICSYSSDKPEWHCASGNFEPFGEIPAPYP